MPCAIWLAGSLLPRCDVMSLLVLLISLPLPRYLCLTTALLCVIALSAVAVWLHGERASSLLGPPASMKVASPPSEQVAREARQGEAYLPAQRHAGREPEVKAALALGAVPPYVSGQSEPFILPALTAANRLPCGRELSVRRLELPFLGNRKHTRTRAPGGAPAPPGARVWVCLRLPSGWPLGYRGLNGPRCSPLRHGCRGRPDGGQSGACRVQERDGHVPVPGEQRL